MAAGKTRIRTNDIVQVVSGEEGGRKHVSDGEEHLRGRRGRVLKVDREAGRAIVEGLNMVFKHQRQNRDGQQQAGGRTEKEAPLALSNLMVVCPKCDKPTRVAVRVEETAGADGRQRRSRVRLCKKCGGEIPERVG